MRQIETQGDLNELLASFSWEDAFIREAHVLSPSYVRDRITAVSVVAPDSAPGLRVLVCAPDRRTPALELLFDGVEDVVLPFRVDLEPRGVVLRGRVEFSFSPTARAIIAQSVRCEAVGIEAWEERLRYGKEPTGGCSNGCIR